MRYTVRGGATEILMELTKLKSGTDVRGTASAGYGKEVDLTVDAARSIAAAFGAWLDEKAAVVAVGGDSRISTPTLREAVIDVLSDEGFTVLDCGLCSTPSMFMTTKIGERIADAAVMITASHHPAEKNGLKFIIPSGGLSASQLGDILVMAQNGEKRSAQKRGSVIKYDFISVYSEFLENKIKAALGDDAPLKGLKIVVDAGNGAGAFYERVLARLGADTDGSRFLEPDGTFPNHIPNPENAAAMDAIRQSTLDSGADLGVIFDTDVDRAAVVDGSGEEINRNALIALISAIILREEPGATIVTDSVTSDGLKKFIEARGGKHHRFKRGYKNVIDEAIRLEGEGVLVPLAIETSGHAALKENYYLDDGAYLVTRLIIEAARLKKQGKSLVSLISDLEKPLEEGEARVTFTTEHWREEGEFIIENIKGLKQKGLVLADDNREGVRVSVPAAKGWFLIRMSVHDPVMPINIESNEAGGVKKISRIVQAYLSAFDGLVTDKLEELAR